MTGDPVRLAMLVAYHFDPFLQPLVDIHLDRLRRHAPPGFVIMGAPIRLAGPQQSWLAAQPDVVLPPVGPLPEGRREEHNAALDALARIAFADGATHVATFHQDSFPVSDDWFSRLAADLDAATVFAAAEPRAYNSCMVWGRAWQDRAPTMLVAPTDQHRQDHARFMAAHPHLDDRDGGIGHLVQAWSTGLRWRPLRNTTPEILDGTVMHLTGATRMVHSAGGNRLESPTITTLRRITRPIRSRLPKAWRDKAMTALTRKDWSTPVGVDGSPEEKRNQITRLIADPDGFITAACAAGGR